MLLHDEIFQESLILFPIKHEKVDMDKLSDEIRTVKNEISDSEVTKFYSSNKKYIDTSLDLIKNWAKYGAILGAATIPFSLTLSFIRIVLLKFLKLVKTESDKNMYIEYTKLYIEELFKIKNKNSDNVVLVAKIENMIDFCNSCINKIL